MPSRRFGLFAVAVLGVAPHVGAQALFSGAAHTSTPPGTATDPGMQWFADDVGGVDTNVGNNRATPIATLARVKAMANAGYFRPGDTVRLMRGDTWRESLVLLNTTSATSAATTQITNPMPMAGVTIGAYGTAAALNASTGLPSNDPIIDSADPITLSWAPVSGTTATYVASLATCPAKLFGSVAESVQYQPVFNYRGTYDSSGATSYNCLDEVYYATSSNYQANFSGLTTNALIASTPQVWSAITVSSTSLNSYRTQTTTPTTAQLTQSGLQNVEAATINAYWYDSVNQLLYVTTASGAAPPTTMYATNPARPYGVLIQGSSLNLSHLQFAHGLKGAVKCLPYAYTSYGYVPCQNMTWAYLSAYNIGDQTTHDRLAQQGGYEVNMAGFVITTNYNENVPTLEAGNSISNVYSGQSDAFNSEGIIMVAQDGTQTVGGVTTNRSVISNSRCVNTSLCMVYGNPGFSYSASSVPTAANINYYSVNKVAVVDSKGGMVNNNDATGWHLTAFGFSGVEGGDLNHNVGRNGGGEVIQGGGGSQSSPVGDWTTLYIRYNVGMHSNASDTGSGYNFIDTNDGGCSKVVSTQVGCETLAQVQSSWGPGTVGEVIDHNTGVDFNSSAITTEPNEAQAVVTNNLIYPIGDGMHNAVSAGTVDGQAFYGVALGAQIGTGPIYARNAIAGFTSTSGILAQFDNSSNERMTCGNMATFIPSLNSSGVGDSTSQCDYSATVPSWFNNMTNGVGNDFSIPTTSFPATFLGAGNGFAGASVPGQPMFTTGPQADPHLYQ